MSTLLLSDPTAAALVGLVSALPLWSYRHAGTWVVGDVLAELL